MPHNTNVALKPSASEESVEIIPRIAAVGDKNNERITNCRICRENGFPHEPIDFEKIPGRMLSDGTRETAGWRLKNYYNGEPHQHKQVREDPIN